MTHSSLYLLEPGRLGVLCVERGAKRNMEMGFATLDGLERLLGALPLQGGDYVSMRRTGAGGDFWQDALEALLLSRYPDVLPVTHELSPQDAKGVLPDGPAPGAAIYCYIDHGVDEVTCAPVVPVDATPGARAFPLPVGWYALRLIAARPDGAPWLFDARQGCSRPGQKELVRSTLCMMPANLAAGAGPADFLVDLKPGGEMEVTLREILDDGFRAILCQTIPPVRRRS